MAKVKGKVKFYDTKNGFGFITPDGGGTEIFLGSRFLEKSGLTTVKDGEVLIFDVVKDDKYRNPHAENISKVV